MVLIGIVPLAYLALDLVSILAKLDEIPSGERNPCIPMAIMSDPKKEDKISVNSFHIFLNKKLPFKIRGKKQKYKQVKINVVKNSYPIKNLKIREKFTRTKITVFCL